MVCSEERISELQRCHKKVDLPPSEKLSWSTEHKCTVPGRGARPSPPEGQGILALYWVHMEHHEDGIIAKMALDEACCSVAGNTGTGVPGYRQSAWEGSGWVALRIQPPLSSMAA